jgi:hypothetical protein
MHQMYFSVNKTLSILLYSILSTHNLHLNLNSSFYSLSYICPNHLLTTLLYVSSYAIIITYFSISHPYLLYPSKMASIYASIAVTSTFYHNIHIMETDLMLPNPHAFVSNTVYHNTPNIFLLETSLCH